MLLLPDTIKSELRVSRCCWELDTIERHYTKDRETRKVGTKKTKLTWDEKGKRWRKVYKGATWQGSRGVKKSDPDAYRQAIEDFEAWRGGIGTKTNESKPNTKEYERAIFVRNEMIRACRLEGNTELHDRYISEIVTIRKNLAKKAPPKLNTIVLPLERQRQPLA
jgi:hypothetical protein